MQFPVYKQVAEHTIADAIRHVPCMQPPEYTDPPHNVPPAITQFGTHRYELPKIQVAAQTIPPDAIHDDAHIKPEEPIQAI
jgi:hypothetical protein